MKFWRTLEISFINSEISLVLTWCKIFILTDILTHVAAAAQGSNPARPKIRAPTNASWKIASTKP